MYEFKGRAIPQILPRSEFLEQQQAILDALPLQSPDETRAEIRYILHLMENIDRYQDQMHSVEDMERSIVGDMPAGRQSGGITEHSQIGYVVWLESLATLYKGDLTNLEYRTIHHMTDVLRQIADDRAILRDIQDHYRIPEYVALQGVTAFPYHKAMQEYAHDRAQQLEETGEVYLVAGFKGHHVVGRLVKDGEGYVYTSYNAGAEAKKAPSSSDNLQGGLVMGVVEQRLKPGVNPEDFIRVLTERKIRANPKYEWGAGEGYISAVLDMEGMLEPEILRHRLVTPQTRGNCTTRSTRHALEDAIGVEAMQRLGRYVADPDVSVGADLMVALDMRKEVLQQHLEKQGQDREPEGGKFRQ
ncbi:MAG: hypothetical protein J0L97_05400 [Alphaproteobacteria bacterium]|nr:hypothetical protein [Alphaproteobacteria bacterium]